MTEFKQIQLDNGELFALPVKFYFATTKSKSGTRWYVQFDGSEDTIQNPIKAIYGISLTVDVRVLVMEVSGTFMILARLT